MTYETQIVQNLVNSGMDREEILTYMDRDDFDDILDDLYDAGVDVDTLE